MGVRASTYRLQLHREFTLRDAARLVPYFDGLGVAALYLSPVTTSRPGSLHGYDVIDPLHIDPELGGRAAFDELAAALRKRDMGLLIDIVPNHMAAIEENPWWRDVLKRGAKSAHAAVFDVDWDAGDGRVRTDERNYRRFFDIDDLVGVRVEDPEIFDRTHRLVVSLAGTGRVDGVRIDHIDGLADPHRYLDRLRQALGGDVEWVIVEKILEGPEELPAGWPVEGTVGYEWMAALDGMFVDPAGYQRLATAARNLTGLPLDPAATALECKRLVLRTLFDAEVHRLARMAHTALGQTAPEFEQIRDALVEITAHLPVYRTYFRDDGADATDRRRLRQAVRGARAALGPNAALRDVSGLLATDPDIAVRWQQLSGPATAKGVEDTMLYRHPILLSRNEVGADPAHPATTPNEFHALNRRRLTQWPGGLNATSTHDTKRSEDVRARLNAISEVPDRWIKLVRSWHTRYASLREEIDGYEAPDPTEELTIYQSAVGAWPLSARRLQTFMEKAGREAKVHTSWREPNDRHERAVRRFAGRLLKDEAFAADVQGLLDVIDAPAAATSLAAVVLKVISPGVPDIYQGAELWHRRLVDPDNRIDVDFNGRERALRRLAATTDPAEIAAAWPDGRVKLYVLARCLAHRRTHTELYLNGAYVPCEASGTRSAHVVAAARRRSRRWAVAVVPRLCATLAPGRLPTGRRLWTGTAVHLPSGAPSELTDVLTGSRVQAKGGVLEVADVLGALPVALLTNTAVPHERDQHRTIGRRY